MNAIPKKKLCWNCEGNVSVAEENCPYCGVSVRPPSLEGVSNNFTPPYQMAHTAKNQTIPPSPYAPQIHEESKIEEEKENNQVSSSLPTGEFKNVLIPMLFLLAGSVFFLFGMVLLLFSQNGLFKLSWNGNLWYLYLLVSVPLLFIGWMALQKLKE